MNRRTFISSVMFAGVNVALSKTPPPPDAPVEGFDRGLVAAVIIAEGGGHGRQGMEAIYEVIHARATKKNTSCVYEVRRPWQFSCLNGKKTYSQQAEFISKMRKHREYKWVMSMLRFVPITSHVGTNPYNRGLHYCAVDCYPKWARGKTPFKVFGGHKWYRGIQW
jgi:hypothetical protein